MTRAAALSVTFLATSTPLVVPDGAWARSQATITVGTTAWF